jgi:3-phosphoshikimate 1-carboxyvinyltransferase
MPSKIIKPIKKLYGEITLPGDKSISHRAVMIGSIARGRTRIKGLLDCDDCNYTIRAFREMGVNIGIRSGLAVIEGSGLRGLKRPRHAISVGESGTTMRILAGILAGQDFESRLTGDKSLLRRPMNRIIEPLALMDAKIKSRPRGFPPLVINGGRLRTVSYRMPVPSAQVKSAILFAGLYADGKTVVEEAFRSRDHTERMLELFGAKVKVDGLRIIIDGQRELRARDIEVPGDISSASFFMAGAILLKGSKLKIKKVGINPTRAGIVKVLSKMGARIKVRNKKNLFEPVADIEAESGPTGGTIIGEDMIPALIDELPVICVIASLSRGKTVIRGAGELRVKETDRIGSMTENLRAMGADIEVRNNDIVIEGVSQLRGAELKSFGDHRTCMAITVAAMAAKGESSVDDTACVSKSFPGFFETLKKVTG